MSESQENSFEKVKGLIAAEARFLSQTSSAFYLLISALVGFLIIRLFTAQEFIVALGTIVFAVMGMWLLAVAYSVRLIIRSLKHQKLTIPMESRNKTRGGIINEPRRLS